MVNYYLNEQQGWGLDVTELEASYKNAKDRGVNIKAITVINPGNPTGQVLSRKNIENIITFAFENHLAILADEVYQENIYVDKKFVSFKKVLSEMPDPIKSSVELLSFHSVSKGVSGECGLRGGYFEFVNINNYAEQIALKMKSVNLCSNTVGMLAMGLMVNPPKKGRESDSVVNQYLKEKNEIFDGLKKRAKMVT